MIGMGAVYGVCMASLLQCSGGRKRGCRWCHRLRCAALFLLTLFVTSLSSTVQRDAWLLAYLQRSLFSLVLRVLGVTMA